MELDAVVKDSWIVGEMLVETGWSSHLMFTNDAHFVKLLVQSPAAVAVTIAFSYCYCFSLINI